MGNYFQIKNFNIYIPKVKENIQITCIADLHFSHLINQKKLDKLRDRILSYSSNYICIVGDLLDFSNIVEEKEKLKQIRAWLLDLSNIPIIISLGNHDLNACYSKKWEYFFPQKFVDQMNTIPNIYILDNDIYFDKNIIISGYTLPYFEQRELTKEEITDYLEKMDVLNSIDSSLPSIAMVHNPIYLKEKEISKYFKNYDLVLAGHMHNGVVPPILDSIWKSDVGLLAPNRKLFPHNARGMSFIETSNNRIPLVVSGGITKLQETAPKILCPCDALFPMSIENITLTNYQKIKNT